MNKVLIGASALLLSGTTLAGVVNAGSLSSSVTGSSAVAADGAAWAINPMLQPAIVNAGLMHAHARTNWMADHAAADMSGEVTVEKPDGDADGGDVVPKEAGRASGTRVAGTAQKASLVADHGGSDEMALAEGGSDYASADGVDVAGAVDMAGSANLGASADMGQTADMSMAQATQSSMDSWPACRPGPGDDHCIQLYEGGVRAAYAQWSSGRERLAMGGPEEPVTGKDAMASADTQPMSSDMAAPAKVQTSGGPTTQPTGVRVAKSVGTAAGENMPDMAASTADTITHDGMTAEEMQANSAWGARTTAG